MVLIIGVLVLITVNVILLSITSNSQSTFGLGRVGLSFVAPFQEIVTRCFGFARNIWQHYFFLVSAAHENDILKKSLNQFTEKNNLLSLRIIKGDLSGTDLGCCSHMTLHISSDDVADI